MEIIMRKLFLSFALILLAIPSLAMDLNEARSNGSLGEQANGFVKVLKPSAEVNALAEKVNSGRKTEYERISKENGQPVSVVGTLAAEQIAKKLGK
jgi:uncharacterized protein YdbL (DUF1318 family)